MEIDKKIIKAMSVDTRVDIMKSLAIRRKMPSELQREFDMAGSTIVQHLKILEDSGLVRKEERGPKFVYYSLTKKGEDLIKPKGPIQVFLMLGLGVFFMISSFVRYYSEEPMMMVAENIPIARDAVQTVSVETSVQGPDWTLITLIILAIVFLIIGIFRWKEWKLK